LLTRTGIERDEQALTTLAHVESAPGNGGRVNYPAPKVERPLFLAGVDLHSVQVLVKPGVIDDTARHDGHVYVATHLQFELSSTRLGGSSGPVDPCTLWVGAIHRHHGLLRTAGQEK
jgi:hypothetical protein